MNTLVRNVQLLHSVTDNVSLGTYHKNCSYIVGYVYPNDALYATRHLSKNVKINMTDYEPSLQTRVIETEEGKQVLIVLDQTFPVHISKQYSPEFDWYTEEMDLQTFFSIPLTRNIGLVMPFDKVDETENEMIFQSYIVDPVYDASMFRHGLKLD